MTSLEERLRAAAEFDSKDAQRLQGRSIADSFILLTGFPTYIRRQMEHVEQESDFFYQISPETARKVVPYLMMGTLLSQPKLLYPLLGTNVLSLVYEAWRSNYLKKSIVPSKPSTAPTKKDSPRPQIHRTFAQKARSWIWSYALAGTLALTHYTSSTLFKKDEFQREEVNVELLECHLERTENKVYDFYLLGEQHQYNYSSSFYVERFLEQHPIDSMLSEGSSNRSGLFYTTLAAGHFIVSKGSGFEYPTPRDVAMKRSIPCFALESPNSYGTPTGMSRLESVLFTSVFTIGVTALAPSLYFLAVPLRYIPADDDQQASLLGELSQNSGILRGREEAMTKSAISIIEKYLFSHSLIRVGQAHLPGMQRQLQKYGELHCRPIPKEEIL